MTGHTPGQARGLWPAVWLFAALCVVLSPATPGARAQNAHDERAPAARDEIPIEDLVTITMLEDRRARDDILSSYLESPMPALRARAALAIGRIGRVEDVGALASLLDDPVALVRRHAAFALGEIADSSAAVPILARLENGEGDADVRELALEALGKLGRGAEACRGALSDPSPAVRARALLAIWRVPAREILDDVLPFVHESDGTLRWAATYCLMRLAGATASGRTPIPDVPSLTPDERARVREPLLWLARDPEARVRHVALRALRSFDGPDVLAAITARADDSDWRARVEAVRALAAEIVTDAGTAPRAVEIRHLEPFLADAHPNVRVTAVEALSGIGAAPDAEARLHAHLEAPLLRVRSAALETLLARWTREKPEDPMTAAHVAHRVLESGHWTLRAALPPAAELLPARRGDELLSTLVRDEDPRVVKHAVGPYLARAARGGDGSLWERLAPVAAPFVRAEDPMVRLMALTALADAIEADTTGVSEADREAFETTIGQAYQAASESETYVDVRETIVGIAARWPERRAMQRALTAACMDPNHVVRVRAVAAMKAAGLEPTRAAEPVETRRTREGYREILAWAERPRWAVIETDAGRIVAELFTRDAPLTTWNFARLATDAYFDEGRWHRVVPNFVVQGGCPRGDGWGGPGHQIRCEINPARYERGAIGMALSGKDTGGSQFFITHSEQPHLDGGYTVFGRVVSGMDRADAVAQGDAIVSIRVADEESPPEP